MRRVDSWRRLYSTLNQRPRCSSLRASLLLPAFRFLLFAHKGIGNGERRLAHHPAGGIKEHGGETGGFLLRRFRFLLCGHGNQGEGEGRGKGKNGSATRRAKQRSAMQYCCCLLIMTCVRPSLKTFRQRDSYDATAPAHPGDPRTAPTPLHPARSRAPRLHAPWQCRGAGACAYHRCRSSARRRVCRSSAPP